VKKFLPGGIGAALAAAMLVSLAPAPAEARVPGGSYLETCRQVRAHGNTVSALCRRMDGRWTRTTLSNANRCVGGIANANGRLTCNMGRHHGSRRGHQWQGHDAGRGHDARRGNQWYGYGAGRGQSWQGHQGGHYWYGR
jgi:hypothetical protein